MMDNTLKIFISYRTADNRHFVAHLRTWLVVRYGRENVFMDFDSLPNFTEFPDFIREKIEACDVFMPIIGPDWIHHFEVRADAERFDFVRMEIETAIANNKLIAPIRILDAPVPPEDRIPPSVASLFRLQIPHLRDDGDLIDKINPILNDIEKRLEERGQLPARTGPRPNTVSQAINLSDLKRQSAGFSSMDAYHHLLDDYNAGRWEAA